MLSTSKVNLKVIIDTNSPGAHKSKQHDVVIAFEFSYDPYPAVESVEAVSGI